MNPLVTRHSYSIAAVVSRLRWQIVELWSTIYIFANSRCRKAESSLLYFHLAYKHLFDFLSIVMRTRWQWLNFQTELFFIQINFVEKQKSISEYFFYKYILQNCYIFLLEIQKIEISWRLNCFSSIIQLKRTMNPKHKCIIFHNPRWNHRRIVEYCLNVHLSARDTRVAIRHFLQSDFDVSSSRYSCSYRDSFIRNDSSGYQ